MPPPTPPLPDHPILVVGAGGIGAPAALALGHAGVTRLCIVDDDQVELGNLHRQILFDEGDVGTDKLAALRRALVRRLPALEIELRPGRALPDTALELCAGAAVVIDATDNFASRFLLADAAHLAGVPIVHAAAVRWQATVLAVAAAGRPCYRCLFEDVPAGVLVDCATAGVAGPVCGVSGALAADRALDLCQGRAPGTILTYDGERDRLREVAVAARRDCPLCGEHPTIGSLDAARYMPPACEGSD
ncbi:MAG: ThiF family adenylyltransferase [Myxococcales bacterium]|nr:ThiF family adenylyltransferase [Myxococcales bacterium]